MTTFRTSGANVTPAEYAAIYTLKRAKLRVLAACNAHTAETCEFLREPLRKCFTEEGEIWAIGLVEDMHEAYLTENEPEMILLAREWVKEMGTLATMNIARIIRSM